MSLRDYESGKLNGCIPPDTEYGSRAYWDAAQGAWDARDQKIRELDASAYNHQPYQYSSSPSAGGASSALLVAFGFVCYYAWQVASNWAILPYPYKAVAFYYYWVAIYPLKGFAWVWSFLTSPGFTSHPYLNLVIGVCGVFGYAISLFMCLGFIGGVLQIAGLRSWWKTLLFAPLGFCLLWFLGTWAYSWFLALQ